MAKKPKRPMPHRDEIGLHEVLYTVEKWPDSPGYRVESFWRTGQEWKPGGVAAQIRTTTEEEFLNDYEWQRRGLTPRRWTPPK